MRAPASATLALVAVYGIAAQSLGQVTHASSGVHPPVLLSQVDADLPNPRPKDLKSGEVLVSLTVDESGRAVEVHIARSCDDRLNASVIHAVQQWRFRPAMQDGHPVTFKMNIALYQNLF